MLDFHSVLAPYPLNPQTPDPHLFAVDRLLIVGHVHQLGLQRAAEGDDGLPAVLRHPLEHLRAGTSPDTLQLFVQLLGCMQLACSRAACNPLLL